MIRNILFVAALAACHHVRACDCTLPQNYGNKQCAAQITAALKGVTPSNAAATSTANQSASLSATQGQGQSQGQGQNAYGGSVGNTTASGGAGGQANATGGQGGSSKSNSSSAGGSVSGVTSTATGGTSQSTSAGGTVDYAPQSTTNVAAARIPVNTAVAGFQMTSAPCRYAEGLGVQTTPAGGSIGFTFKDHDCMRFHLAEVLYARGQDAAADLLMCGIGEIKKALGPNCIAIIHVQPPAPPIALAPPPAANPERMYTQAQVDVIARKLVSK
jgi:hypothetical protein